MKVIRAAKRLVAEAKSRKSDDMTALRELAERVVKAAAN